MHLRRCAQCGHIGCCDSLAEPARERARRRDRAPHRAELRAGRELVLGLREPGLLRRAEARRSAAPPDRPDRARAARTACPPTGADTSTDVADLAAPGASRRTTRTGRTERRALRAAVVVPVNFAIGSQLIGNAQVATFAAFGSFALLLFVELPAAAGRRGSARTPCSASSGSSLIALGTLVATPDWLAVVAMAVVAFARAVRRRGQLGDQRPASQAALLAFILRGDAARRTARICPTGCSAGRSRWRSPSRSRCSSGRPHDQNVLRASAPPRCAGRWRRCCDLDQPAPGEPRPAGGDARRPRELRAAFRASAARTGRAEHRRRLLIRLVDELEWLTTIVVNACADAPERLAGTGPAAARGRGARCCSRARETLDHDGDGPARPAVRRPGRRASRGWPRPAPRSPPRRSSRCGKPAVDAVADAGVTLAAPSDRTAGEFERPLYAAHELGYAVALAGRTVPAIAAADSRVVGRLIGRRPTVDAVGGCRRRERVAAGHFDRHSVWLQSSIRGAVGLALAVLLARLSTRRTPSGSGSARCRCCARTRCRPGATVLRALLGTVARLRDRRRARRRSSAPTTRCCGRCCRS